MFEFIKSYGVLIIAIYGVVQVWLIALYKKYIKVGEIEIYETGNIDLGYSTFGATLGLSGTLRALNQDVFVESIAVVLTRSKDKAEHTFQWLAFRSPQIY